MGGDRGEVQSEGTQDIVGAVVPACLIDRQDLHGTEIVPSSPFDHFAEGLCITYAQIMPASHGEERDEKSRDFFLRIKRHTNYTFYYIEGGRMVLQD